MKYILFSILLCNPGLVSSVPRSALPTKAADHVPLLDAGLECGGARPQAPAPTRAASGRGAAPQVGAGQPPAALKPPAVPRPLPAAAAAAPWKRH